MYVPTHLRAHTPYICGDAMPTGTLTAHACTGRHRSPGAAGRDASLRLLCGAGAGTRLAGSTPQGGAQGRTWDSQPSPLLSHLSLPHGLGRARRQARDTSPQPPSRSHRPALPPARNHGVAPCSQPLLGTPRFTLCRPRVPEAPSPPRAACGQAGRPGPSPRGGCRSARRSRPSRRSHWPVPLRSLWKLSVQQSG